MEEARFLSALMEEAEFIGAFLGPIADEITGTDQQTLVDFAALASKVLRVKKEPMQNKYANLAMHSFAWALCSELCKQMSPSDRARFVAKICEYK